MVDKRDWLPVPTRWTMNRTPGGKPNPLGVDGDSVFVTGVPMHVELITDIIVGKPLRGEVIGLNDRVVFKTTDVESITGQGQSQVVLTKQDRFVFVPRPGAAPSPGLGGLKVIPRGKS